jgi:phage baseplate assembly protein gpV
MSAMLELVRQVVREELAMRRGPRLATVSAVHAHAEADDPSNYEADLRLKHDGLELRRVPIAVAHAGVAAPPRVGDLVLVQFMDHDLQQPFVTGRFYHEDERAPLFREDDILFEHRVPDGKLNHLRFAADGSIYLQRDVTKPEDNTEFLAGIRIGADGEIQVKTGDKVTVTLRDGEVEVTCDGGPVTITCDELTVDGKLRVTGDAHLEGTLKVGTGTGVTIDGTEITGGPV